MPPDRDAGAPALSPRPWRLPLPAAAVVLAVLCSLAYWNGLRADFAVDGRPIILDDPRVRATDWAGLRRIVTENYWWPTGETDLYRPLTTLSFWFNYTILGSNANATGYHAVNLLLHWLNAVLAFVLVGAVTTRPATALVSAAVFATHPLTVEAVTNVVGRSDLLAAMSLFGGLCIYRRCLRLERPRSVRWLAALSAVCLAGTLSKESAVVLPALLLLHDTVFPVATGGGFTANVQSSARRVWPAYLATVPGLAVLLWSRWTVLHDTPGLGTFGLDNPIVNASALTRFMTAVKVIGYYLALFVWPARLSCDYSYNAITLFGSTPSMGQDLHAWLALVAVLALGGLATAMWRRSREVSFFLGLAAIPFLPVSNLLFPIGTIMAERLMYVPLLGLSAAAVSVVAVMAQRLTRVASKRPSGRWSVIGAAVSVAVVSALVVRTVNRNGDWDGDVRAWSSAARVVPESYKVHKALAAATVRQGASEEDVDKALALAARSIRIVDQSGLPLHQLPASLFEETGSYHLQKSRHLDERGERSLAEAELSQAIVCLERAETVDREVNRLTREKLARSGLPPARIHDIGSPFIYLNLGSAYLAARRPLEAVRALSYLQNVEPRTVEAYYLRGVAEEALARLSLDAGNTSAATSHLDLAAVNLLAAIVLNPDYEQSWEVLPRVYQQISPDQPAVVTIQGQSTLNRDNAALSHHLRVACEQLLRLMRGAGLADAARTWRDRMIGELHVPLESPQ